MCAQLSLILETCSPQLVVTMWLSTKQYLEKAYLQLFPTHMHCSCCCCAGKRAAKAIKIMQPILVGIRLSFRFWYKDLPHMRICNTCICKYSISLLFSTRKNFIKYHQSIWLSSYTSACYFRVQVLPWMLSQSGNGSLLTPKMLNSLPSIQSQNFNSRIQAQPKTHLGPIALSSWPGLFKA